MTIKSKQRNAGYFSAGSAKGEEKSDLFFDVKEVGDFIIADS
jgi:hypothetical protein